MEQGAKIVGLTINQSKLKYVMTSRDSFDQQNLEIKQKVYENVE